MFTSRSLIWSQPYTSHKTYPPSTHTFRGFTIIYLHKQGNKWKLVPSFSHPLLGYILTSFLSGCLLVLKQKLLSLGMFLLLLFLGGKPIYHWARLGKCEKKRLGERKETQRKIKILYTELLYSHNVVVLHLLPSFPLLLSRFFVVLNSVLRLIIYYVIR